MYLASRGDVPPRALLPRSGSSGFAGRRRAEAQSMSPGVGPLSRSHTLGLALMVAVAAGVAVTSRMLAQSPAQKPGATASAGSAADKAKRNPNDVDLIHALVLERLQEIIPAVGSDPAAADAKLADLKKALAD